VSSVFCTEVGLFDIGEVIAFGIVLLMFERGITGMELVGVVSVGV
jgi:hypothetical protein